MNKKIWKILSFSKWIAHKILPKVLFRRLSLSLKFFFRVGYWPNVRFPSTFNDWLLYIRVYSQFSDLHVVTADKVRVRDYVKGRVIDLKCPPLIQTLSKPEDLDWESLPNSFVAKAAHGSGGNVFVYRKTDVSRAELIKQCGLLLAKKHGKITFEDYYLAIPKRVIIEELLLDEDNRIPMDYKFFSFRGQTAFIQVDVDRFGQHRRSLYDTKWNMLTVQYEYPISEKVDRPIWFDEMLATTRILGADFDFVRIDFFSMKQGYYFGELTHVPAAGFEPLPRLFDQWLGDCWRSAQANASLPPMDPRFLRAIEN